MSLIEVKYDCAGFCDVEDRTFAKSSCSWRGPVEAESRSFGQTGKRITRRTTYDVNIASWSGLVNVILRSQIILIRPIEVAVNALNRRSERIPTIGKDTCEVMQNGQSS